MLGHNLTKQVQNLYTENSKTLKTDIKDQTKGETYGVHG